MSVSRKHRIILSLGRDDPDVRTHRGSGALGGSPRGVLLGWGAGAVLYYAGLALLFAFAGFLSRGNGRMTRMVVGGLGVLLVAVKTGLIFVPLAWGVHPWHGPIEITCLVVGIASILAAGYVPDDK